MTVSEILETMDYGAAPESATEALDWIAQHKGRFGHFIDGRFNKSARIPGNKNIYTVRGGGLQGTCLCSNSTSNLKVSL